MQSDLEAFLAELPQDIPPQGRELVKRAYLFAQQAHEGQKRISGEPYFTHCVATARILIDLRMDAQAIAAALLHDVLEETEVTEEELREKFGEKVSSLVAGVTKITRIPRQARFQRRKSKEEQNAEYLRNMLFAMGDDARVILIKLADRLHNMRTLASLPHDRQLANARETLDIFAPLAERIGLWKLKSELEDLSFRYLEPEKYREIVEKLESTRLDREKYLKRVTDRLRQALEKAGIEATIEARPKHIYSIYRKMQRKKIPLERVYDIHGVRIIVDDEATCYQVLGIVHGLWRPISSEFDDYIAAPKDNTYKSLHTTVITGKDEKLEVQIRTYEMHWKAEYGIAAHWRYKEGMRGRDRDLEDRLEKIREVLSLGKDYPDPEEFLEAVRHDLFQDRIYVLSPKGDVFDLPEGATPIDFAYRVHTEIGHRCRGARVNDRPVPLTYKLKSGDKVEILTAKRGGPSYYWLDESRGYVYTKRARTKIRQWWRRRRRQERIAQGKEAVDRVLRRMDRRSMKYEDVAALFEKYRSKRTQELRVDDFLAAVGAGNITETQIANRILEAEQEQESVPQDQIVLPPELAKTMEEPDLEGSIVLGIGGDSKGLLMQLAKCCRPVHGDPIVGYISRGRGIIVHRASCPNIINIREKERLVRIWWGEKEKRKLYSVPVEVVAQNRVGLLQDLASVAAERGVGLSNVSIPVNSQDVIAVCHFTLEVPDLNQLTYILSRFEEVKGVIEARRLYDPKNSHKPDAPGQGNLQS